MIGGNIALVSDRNVDWLREKFGVELTDAPVFAQRKRMLTAEEFAELERMLNATEKRRVVTERCAGCGKRFVGIHEHRANCVAYRMTKGG